MSPAVEFYRLFLNFKLAQRTCRVSDRLFWQIRVVGCFPLPHDDAENMANVLHEVRAQLSLLASAADPWTNQR